ncbi:hypothetical protein PINS_up000970 [Pythium insidiosum]|nr:hypothetical protein PINS_up000970 [Pythium insidiosum]
MNRVLATHLASALLPLEGTRDVTGALCEQLCSHPGFKLLDIKTIPQMPQRSKEFSTHTWTGLLKHLHQMQVANSPLEEGIDWSVSLQTPSGRAWNRAVASALMLRGVDADKADATAFHRREMYTSWSVRPMEVYRTRKTFNHYDKTATLISNSKALLPTLMSTVDKAHDMFTHNAYIHQYQRHGVDKTFFQEAFLLESHQSAEGEITLDLRDRGISRIFSIPPTITKLDVSGNLAVSGDLSQYHSLRTIIAKDCALQSLQGLKLPLNLLNLDVGGNGIPVLPIESLPAQLRSLNASRNALTSIDALSALPSLTMIDATKNRISSIKYLPRSLEALHVSENSITELREITLPQPLQSIELRLNGLKIVQRVRFPDALRLIDLRGNCIDDFEVFRDDIDKFGQRITVLSAPTDWSLSASLCGGNHPGSVHWVGSSPLCVVDENFIGLPPNNGTEENTQWNQPTRSPNGNLPVHTSPVTSGSRWTQEPVGSRANEAIDAGADTSIDRSEGGNVIATVGGAAGIMAALVVMIVLAVHRYRNKRPSPVPQPQAHDEDDQRSREKRACTWPQKRQTSEKPPGRPPLPLTKKSSAILKSRPALRPRSESEPSFPVAASSVDVTELSSSSSSSASSTPPTTSSSSSSTASITTFASTSTASSESADNVKRAALWKDPALRNAKVLPEKAWRKERTLAKWMYGEVFVAHFVGKKKLVIKEMDKKYAKRDTGSMRQFVDEIMLAAKLSHPHIVPFVGITLCDAVSARGYACEFMPRGDLGTILSTWRGRSDYRRSFQWFGSRPSTSSTSANDFPRSKAELAMDLLDGLMYLNALDPPVMHHRLCSRIALLAEDYTLKLSLLGLPGRQRLHEMTDQTPWMAPEVLRGGAYDECAVVYAVGVILTELDTCEYPYRSGIDGFLPANPSMARIAIMVGAGSVQPLLQDDCPGLIRSLVKRCLSFDRADRPTLRQVHDSVERLCRQSQLSDDA